MCAIPVCRSQHEAERLCMQAARQIEARLLFWYLLLHISLRLSVPLGAYRYSPVIETWRKQLPGNARPAAICVYAIRKLTVTATGRVWRKSSCQCKQRSHAHATLLRQWGNMKGGQAIQVVLLLLCCALGCTTAFLSLCVCVCVHPMMIPEVDAQKH